ncbi:synaptonemal complex protein, putative [Entamoeba dispar SAW760]|uniref:Synaptonemal complex protein, putative n=1 Tax=Entamoeba dispar (strain ATCC PRA-260 / SAW760) TaxID=370354 RepID=B0E6D7_ENTDS|nr:synaptonemal complex protein, putative [Entamoeba dispar SAW760]EDR29895.1 synaptonemal complex protein, putative [Entamoeba dispar SAW760]|eukprot:EDR29895.1 synaptonemal complex protein, putative [Entamoeba dispar SAW760]
MKTFEFELMNLFSMESERLTEKKLEFGAGQYEYTIQFNISKKSGSLLDDLFVVMSYKNTKSGFMNEYQGSMKVFSALEGLNKLTQIVECKETEESGYLVSFEYGGGIMQILLKKTKGVEIEKRKKQQIKDTPFVENSQELTTTKEELKKNLLETKIEVMINNFNIMQEQWAQKITESDKKEKELQKEINEIKELKELNERLLKEKGEWYEEQQKLIIWKEQKEEEIKKLKEEIGILKSLKSSDNNNEENEIIISKEEYEELKKRIEELEIKCNFKEELENLKKRVEEVEKTINKIDINILNDNINEINKQNEELNEKVNELKEEKMKNENSIEKSKQQEELKVLNELIRELQETISSVEENQIKNETEIKEIKEEKNQIIQLIEKKEKKNKIPRVMTCTEEVIEICQIVKENKKEKKCLVICQQQTNEIIISVIIGEELFEGIYHCTIHNIPFNILGQIIELAEITKEKDKVYVEYNQNKIELGLENQIEVWPRIVKIYHYIGNESDILLDGTFEYTEEIKDNNYRLKLVGDKEKEEELQQQIKEEPQQEKEEEISQSPSSSSDKTDKDSAELIKEIQDKVKETSISQPKKIKKSKTVFVYSSLPTQFQGRRIQQLGKKVPHYKFTDFWNGYGSCITPDKIVLYYIYEKEECDYQSDLEALKIVYPSIPIITVILNYPEYCLAPPKTNEEDVFVIDVISNILEDGGMLLQFINELTKDE